MVAPITDIKTFESAISPANLSVIHFWAEWAEQCVQINEVLDAISQQPEYSNINFFKIPAEDLSDVSLKYKIEAVPTVLLFKAGKEIDRVDGVDAAKITEKIQQHTRIITSNIAITIPSGTLEERLKALINRSNVMLFMKGDRNTPRCGFSKKIIDILNDTGVSYDTFDILSDEDVRQGLKTFSDWPTYPQLYVKGDLIGGLDIIKEMLDAGDLVHTLSS